MVVRHSPVDIESSHTLPMRSVSPKTKQNKTSEWILPPRPIPFTTENLKLTRLTFPQNRRTTNKEPGLKLWRRFRGTTQVPVCSTFPLSSPCFLECGVLRIKSLFCVCPTQTYKLKNRGPTTSLTILPMRVVSGPETRPIQFRWGVACSTRISVLPQWTSSGNETDLRPKEIEDGTETVLGGR